MLISEVNETSGGIFIDRARNYKNIYTRITIDKQTEEVTTKLGWRTDAMTKGPLLETGYRVIQDCAAQRVVVGATEEGEPRMKNWCPISSRLTLQELIGYEERLVINSHGDKKYEWGAKRGAYDDCAMEACIAFRVIKHEYGRISSCKFAKTVKQSLPDEHNLGQKQREPGRAFRKWKTVPSAKSLRARHAR